LIDPGTSVQRLVVNVPYRGPAFLACSLLLLCGGCTTLPTGRGWGADATIRPGWDRVRDAAVTAARDPWVWAPLAGAAAFQINSFDRRTSDWARENTPLFGSTIRAEQYSDDLRAATGILQFATLLATPSGPDPGEWTANKARGLAVELSAMGATAATTGFLKQTTGRERPNGNNDQSFPSGHTSSASVNGRLAVLNLESIDMPQGARIAADAGVDLAVFGTAWARIEAGAHYPSDVLVGMAIGNFFARFMTGAFLGPESRDAISVAATDGGARLDWTVRF
jgi:membrane-associated phospholipid phosphatase